MSVCFYGGQIFYYTSLNITKQTNWAAFYFSTRPRGRINSATLTGALSLQVITQIFTSPNVRFSIFLYCKLPTVFLMSYVSETSLVIASTKQIIYQQIFQKLNIAPKMSNVLLLRVAYPFRMLTIMLSIRTLLTAEWNS